MALIVGILEAANLGCRGTDDLGSFSLTETGLSAEALDLAGDLVIGPGFLQGGHSLGPSFVIKAMHDFERIAGRLVFANKRPKGGILGTNGDNYFSSNATNRSINRIEKSCIPASRIDRIGFQPRTEMAKAREFRVC